MFIKLGDMSVDMGVGMCTVGREEVNSFLPGRCWGSNSGHRAWWQVFLPAQSCHCPENLLFKLRVISGTNNWKDFEGQSMFCSGLCSWALIQ